MQVDVEYTGNPYQLKTTARGITTQSDAFDQAKNGGDAFQNPHEKFLGSLGECTAMTILMYAKRKGWDIDKLTVKVKEGKIEEPAGSGTKVPHITLSVEIESESLTDEQLDKLKEIGGRCPIKKLVMEAKVIDLDVTRAA
jgi:putative redox protein